MNMQRPGPVQWLWYSLGGKLPDRYREWVLHDATVRTWALRAALRLVLRLLPVLAAVLVLFAVLGGRWWLSVLAVVLGLVVSLYYGMTFAWDRLDNTLMRYGYPPRYGTDVRDRQAAARDRARTERYQARWRQPTH